MRKYLTLVLIFLSYNILGSLNVNAGYIQTINSASASPGQYGWGCSSNSNEIINSNGHEVFYQRYEYNDGNTFETFQPPANLNRSETSSYCEFFHDDVWLNEIRSEAVVDLTTAEIKLLSLSSPSVMTRAEQTSSYGVLYDAIYFRPLDSLTPFRVDVTLNYEGVLSGMANSSIRLRANDISYDKFFLSPASAIYNEAVCFDEVYADLYTCSEHVISESLLFSFYSDIPGDLFQTTAEDGSLISGLGLTLSMSTGVSNLGVSSFNNSSWLNISVSDGVEWFTSSGDFLSNPRANLNNSINDIPEPNAGLLLFLSFIFLVRNKTRHVRC